MSVVLITAISNKVDVVVATDISNTPNNDTNNDQTHWIKLSHFH